MKIKNDLGVFIICIITSLCFSSCNNHGEYITTVRPVRIEYNDIFRKWKSTKILVKYDIYLNNGNYIAVFIGSDGKESSGKEIRVELNPYFQTNHATWEYQYSTQELYFNFHLPATATQHSKASPTSTQRQPSANIPEFNNENNDNVKHSGRTIEQIDTDILKTEKLLTDNEDALRRLQESNSSTTLWASYQRMITDCKDRLIRLNNERNAIMSR